MKQVMAIIDLQFGSTGKGQIAGSLGRIWGPDTVVGANGPNAGHTYKWWASDRILCEIVNTVLPVSSVLPSVRNILLGPGAVIDVDVLVHEANLIQKVPLDRETSPRLIIHPNAALVTPEHRAAEQTLRTIGSTMKGTAEAVIAKMRRPVSPAACIARHMSSDDRNFLNCAIDYVISYEEYDRAIDSSEKMLVEGAQGHSLSIHSQFYPYTTSRDVSIHQLMADCRLPRINDLSYNLFILGVCRTYPIRVANRYDESGQQVGFSGPCYLDQEEIAWEQLGVKPELTTVTKLPRRVFTFSTQQIMEACRINRPNALAMTFCDYVQKSGVRLDAPLSEGLVRLTRRAASAAGAHVGFLSFGPTDRDLYGLSSHARATGYADVAALKQPSVSEYLYTEE